MVFSPFEREMLNSDLSNLDRIVELIYRYCDCTFCKITGVDCPYKDYTEEDINEETESACRKIIRETILKAVEQNNSNT